MARVHLAALRGGDGPAWAVVYASENDVDRAIDAAERSLRLTPEGSSAAPTKELVGKLHQLRAHTRRAPPLAPLPPLPPQTPPPPSS